MASTAQHQEIKAALERYTKEELVDLMEHLLRIYVLNEPVKLDTAVSKPESMKDLSGYTFPQLLTQLQNSMEMEELVCADQTEEAFRQALSRLLGAFDDNHRIIFPE